MAKLIVENATVDGFEFVNQQPDKTKPMTYILKGIYAQSEQKNGNGRRYPYNELKSEIDRFDREMIQTGRALGELEHPECNLTPNFEVLTESGFKWFNQLKVGDLVWTRNNDTKKAELKPIKKIVNQNYKGDGYIVSGKNFYGEFTSNHRFITIDRNGKTEVATIEEIYNNRSKFSHNGIPTISDINDIELISASSIISLDKRTLKIKKIDVQEFDNYGAYCIQVDNMSFFQRVNGKSYWTGNCPEIRPQESAIRILSMKEDNKCWIGESCILASQPEFGIRGTPKGDILLSLVQYGTKVGFSTRAVGEVDDDGVVSNMKLCTIDCVANPSIGQFCESNGERFVNGILESKNFVITQHGDILEAKYDTFENKLAHMPNTFISSKKAEHVGNAFHEFLESLVE